MHDAAGYLNDNFHLQESIFAFLGDDEGFAEQKDVTLAPDANNTEYVLAHTHTHTRLTALFPGLPG